MASNRDPETGLTKKQAMYIEDVLMYPFRNASEHCRAIGIADNTASVWKRDPAFNKALDERLYQQWRDAQAVAQNTMITLAEAQDFNASKYILDSLGFNAKQKVEVSTPDGFNINITSADK